MSNYLSLLKLPEKVIEDVSTNKLSYGHAKAISRLTNEQTIDIVKKIYSKKLSVRDTEALVQRIKSSSRKFKNGLRISIEDNKIIVRGKSKTKIAKAYRIIKKSLKDL